MAAESGNLLSDSISLSEKEKRIIRQCENKLNALLNERKKVLSVRNNLNKEQASELENINDLIEKMSKENHYQHKVRFLKNKWKGFKWDTKGGSDQAVLYSQIMYSRSKEGEDSFGDYISTVLKTLDKENPSFLFFNVIEEYIIKFPATASEEDNTTASKLAYLSFLDNLSSDLSIVEKLKILEEKYQEIKEFINYHKKTSLYLKQKENDFLKKLAEEYKAYIAKEIINFFDQVKKLTEVNTIPYANLNKAVRCFQEVKAFLEDSEKEPYFLESNIALVKHLQENGRPVIGHLNNYINNMEKKKEQDLREDSLKIFHENKNKNKNKNKKRERVRVKKDSPATKRLANIEDQHEAQLREQAQIKLAHEKKENKRLKRIQDQKVFEKAEKLRLEKEESKRLDDERLEKIQRSEETEKDNITDFQAVDLEPDENVMPAKSVCVDPINELSDVVNSDTSEVYELLPVIPIKHVTRLEDFITSPPTLVTQTNDKSASEANIRREAIPETLGLPKKLKILLDQLNVEITEFENNLDKMKPGADKNQLTIFKTTMRNSIPCFNQSFNQEKDPAQYIQHFVRSNRRLIHDNKNVIKRHRGVGKIIEGIAIVLSALSVIAVSWPLFKLSMFAIGKTVNLPGNKTNSEKIVDGMNDTLRKISPFNSLS